MPFQFRKEAIEEDLNSNFPSQGQGNPPLYYSLSEVVVPTYSINNATEGSTLPSFLQTAWDFSTGHSQIENTTANLVTNTGFWKFDLQYVINETSAVDKTIKITITDGISSKTLWQAVNPASGATRTNASGSNEFYVFVKSGETVVATSDNDNAILDVSYRQVATVNGLLVNPLGFSAA